MVADARQAGLPLRAVVADSLYGEHREFKRVLRPAGYGPDRPTRLVAATTDPGRLLASSTWYLVTNLPLASTDLGEVVRIYGLRQWWASHGGLWV